MQVEETKRKAAEDAKKATKLIKADLIAAEKAEAERKAEALRLEKEQAEKFKE